MHSLISVVGFAKKKKVPHSNKTTEEGAESKKEALVLKMKSSSSPCKNQ
jgi:hypothetical protein